MVVDKVHICVCLFVLVVGGGNNVTVVSSGFAMTEGCNVGADIEPEMIT